MMARVRAITSKTGSDPRVYLHRGLTKHWVVSNEVLRDLGFNWGKIVHVSDKQLESIPTAEPITSVNQKIFNSRGFVYCIEHTWSDDFSFGISGWAVGKKTPVKSLTIEALGQKKKVRQWVEKSEIFDYFSTNTAYAVKKNCGFMLIIPRKPTHKIKLTVNNQTGPAYTANYDVKRRPIVADFPFDKNLEQKFRDIVNDKGLSVLEVGSRISPGGINKRDFFKGASDYVGVDYLPGETVDVVGDAHELSKHFRRRKFEALYSDSVLEHLAMPWKAVLEMNKVLKKGGYVFHSAPACWVPHDMPWDFWRFSDAGMKSLFSDPFGFKVIDVSYTAPVSVHVNGEASDEYANFPVSPAFGFVSVLAQKTHNISRRKLRFNFSLKNVVGETTYPKWD